MLSVARVTRAQAKLFSLVMMQIIHSNENFNSVVKIAAEGASTKLQIAFLRALSLVIAATRRRWKYQISYTALLLLCLCLAIRNRWSFFILFYVPKSSSSCKETLIKCELRTNVKAARVSAGHTLVAVPITWGITQVSNAVRAGAGRLGSGLCLCS